MRHLNYYPREKNGGEDGEIADAPEPELPNREFFYGVLGTLEPAYVTKLVGHANRVRNRKEVPDKQDETIEVRPEIWAELEKETYYSRMHCSLTHYIGVKGRASALLKGKATGQR
jgi:hypothetical protein